MVYYTLFFTAMQTFSWIRFKKPPLKVAFYGVLPENPSISEYDKC